MCNSKRTKLLFFNIGNNALDVKVSLQNSKLTIQLFFYVFMWFFRNYTNVVQSLKLFKNKNNKY